MNLMIILLWISRQILFLNYVLNIGLKKMMYIDIITQQTFSNLGQQKGSSQFKKEM